MTAGWVIAGLAQPATYNWSTQEISDLGAMTAQHAWIWDLADSLSGVLIAIFAVGLFSLVGSKRSGRIGTAQLLAKHYGAERVLSERELVFAEQIAGRSIASAEMGEQRGRPRLHRPDLIALTDKGTIAIEVELTPKAPYRLQHIIRAWRRAVAAGILAEVHYLCAPGQTRKAVERAVEKVLHARYPHLSFEITAGPSERDRWPSPAALDAEARRLKAGGDQPHQIKPERFRSTRPAPQSRTNSAPATRP